MNQPLSGVFAVAAALWLFWMGGSFFAFLALPFPLEWRVSLWLVQAVGGNTYLAVVLIWAMGGKR